MWIDLLPPLIYCMAGWLSGRVMFRKDSHATGARSSNHRSQVLAQSDLQSQARPADQSALSQSRLNSDREQAIAEATDRLRVFARTLAADVDAHQTEVQAVNNSLHESTDKASNESICLAVNRLIEANETMQRQLQSAQNQIQSQASQLETAERQAQTDGLTRVGNRRAFDEHFSRQAAKGPGRAGTLALLDIDHFKRFNDAHGHRTGDEVLRVVASMINSRLGEYGIVARYGGEEFAIVLDGYSVRQSIPIVEATRQAIGSREVQFENKRLRVTASIGMAERAPDETADQWLQRADDCLYRSKHHGRDCGHWADADKYRRISAADCAANPTPTLDSHASASISVVESAVANQPRTSPAPEEAATHQTALVESTGAANESSVVGTQAPANSSESQQLQLNPFPYLPDRESLAVAVRELSNHLRATRMPMAIMAIQFNGHVSGPASRSLLQVVRAASRTIDRIGCDGVSTLILCMPNTNDITSLERASQIYRSAEILKLGVGESDSSNLIGIGVTQWDNSDNFESVFDSVQELASAAAMDTTNPIRSLGIPSAIA